MGSGSPQQQLDMNKASRTPKTGKMRIWSSNGEASHSTSIALIIFSPSDLLEYDVAPSALSWISYASFLDFKQTWVTELFNHQKHLCRAVITHSETQCRWRGAWKVDNDLPVLLFSLEPCTESQLRAIYSRIASLVTQSHRLILNLKKRFMVHRNCTCSPWRRSFQL